MVPRIRTIISELPAYVPGKDHPDLVKMSSNENPFEPLPGVLERAVAAAKSMHRYPDLFATELTAAISAKFAVPTGWISVGTGSSGVLQQIMQAVVEPGDEVVHPWRSFEAYPIIPRLSSATVVAVPLGPDGGMDLAAMAGAVTKRTKVVVVCSPNNPTGTAERSEDFVAFLARVPESVLVVLDEAYVEFVHDSRVVDGMGVLASHPNLCLLRTFSKAYGLAGLRVGFALAHPPVAAALRKCAVPFGVSAVAQHAAVESLHREPEIRDRVGVVVRERQRVRQALLDQGWDIPDSEANFVWLPTGERTDEFAVTCQRAGFLVRPFSGEGCRVTISAPSHNNRFLATAGEWIGGRCHRRLHTSLRQRRNA